MTKPRLAAIISAIVASTVAFFVTHRWSLAGTLTGAAIVPVVYSLVSHWSNEGLDRLAGWAHRRIAGRLRRRAAAELDHFPSKSPGTASTATAGTASAPTLYATRGAVHQHRPGLQWWLTAAVLLAFGFSLYSFATAGTAEKVVVEKQVIEKTVLVSSPTTTTTPAQDDSIGGQAPDTSSPPVGETSTSAPAAGSTPPEPDSTLP